MLGKITLIYRHQATLFLQSQVSAERVADGYFQLYLALLWADEPSAFTASE